MTSGYQNQKQFWCRLFLSIMTFVLPFINVEAWATSLPEVQKLSTLTPYEDYIDISQDLAVWAASTPDIGGIQLFAYDFLSNVQKEFKLTNDPGVFNSPPSISDNLILFRSSIWNTVDQRYNYELKICVYDTQLGACGKIDKIDSNAVSAYNFFHINSNRIAWQGLDSATGHNAIFACEYDFAGHCNNKTKVQDLFDGTYDRRAALDIEGDFLVYTLEEANFKNSIYLYDYTTQQKTLLLALPVLSSGYYGAIYMDGDKLAWEEIGNEAYVHYCQLNLSATDKCVDNKFQTASHKGMLRGISGNHIVFIETVDSGSGFLRKVKVLDLDTKEEIEVFSSNLFILRAELQDNKAIWLTSTTVMPNNPDPGVYAYDLTNLPGNESQPTNNNAPTIQIIPTQQIQKLLWDAGFIIKFDVAGNDADLNNLEFTHPAANEVPNGANFNVYQSAPGSTTGQFFWKPTLDQIAGLNWNTQSVGSGINWTSTGNFSSGGINWTDVVDIYTPFAVSDGQYAASTQGHIQPVYKPQNNNGFCDNGLKGYVKNEVASAYGINWDNGVPYQYSRVFYTIGENSVINPNDCKYSVCGDNIIDYRTEACDHNSESCTINGYAGTRYCNSQCTGFDTCLPRELCGDKKINGPEICDGNTVNCTVNGYPGTQTCNLQCTGYNSCTSNLYCGDKIKNGPEVCDDGNTVNGDGCSSTCQSEITYGPNLVSNGDFSSGKNNWSGWNSNIVLDPSGVDTLPYAVKFTLSNNRAQNLAASMVDVQPNKNHIISFKGISTMESGNAVLRVQWKKSNGTNVGQDSYVYFDVRKKNVWDIAQINVQSPDLAVKAKVSIDVSAVSGTFILDDVSIQGQQN